MNETLPRSLSSTEAPMEVQPATSSDQQKATSAPRHGRGDLFVVGIGASAGGLEALETFFDHMPSDSGMAFVIVQHLWPDFKSHLPELLARHTAMAVHLVGDGTVVQRNAIYLVPASKETMISGGRLLLTDGDPSVELRFPIDVFFRSLAQDLGEHAVGIVLSGAGTDGSGIRSIHGAGGWVLVQIEDTAALDGMPRSAIAAGLVDLELAPAAMPAALLDHVGHPDYGATHGRSTQALANEVGMNAVYSLLRVECGLDFSHYLPSMVARRVDRRMLRRRAAALDEYVAQLRSDRQELNVLYSALLIGVTRFFRDPDLFERLKNEVVSAILAKVAVDDEIRVWVAGCATGEEAYSLAILFHESLVAAKRQINVKILATDVHRASLQFASAGLYDEAALREVSPQRLDRYFTRQACGYQISQDLRRMVVFAPQHVFKDAPFTKLDLISCRNLLIYLQADVQQKALSLFHFGLETAGMLVLGTSETLGAIAGEFETLDSRWRIYRKLRNVRLATSTRPPMSAPLPSIRFQSATSQRSASSSIPASTLAKLYDELLVAYVPPSLLVNAQRELLHSFGGAGRFLRIHDGRATSDVLEMVNSELRSAISGALQRAMNDGASISCRGSYRSTSGEMEFLKVCVRPLNTLGTGETHFLISLEPEVRSALSIAPEIQERPDAEPQKHLGLLEEELRHTKEILQATVEEMANANQELQATNEELVASNEELQITNEERQSVNAELHAVNAEHQRKIQELTELTDDMDNLLRSTDVGTVFLDRDLLIRKYTPKIAHAFQLLPQDVGRSIECFAHNILRDNLLEDLRSVLESEEPIEHDVQDRLGEWFLLRILPYRTKVKVEGIVVTLIAITRLKRTEQELRRVSKVFMDGADPIIIEDLAGRIVDLNREAERAYGWSRAELLGKSISVLVPPELEGQLQVLGADCRADDSVRNVESVRRDRFGNDSPVLLTLSLLSDDTGGPTSMASISKDITKQKRAEEDAREASCRRDQFLAMLSHELRNPLGALLNATTLLERIGDDASRKACAVIERQSKHMARLLDDLLDVARVTQGKIHTRSEVIDLRTIANEAVQVVGPLLDHRQHVLTIDLPGEPIFVEGDSARLLQVQENLLANAARYTLPGGEILLSITQECDEAVLRVRDSGIGIEQEMQEKIFELFVQGPKPLERFESGMGIGLTLVRKIVRLHGGRVSVRSAGLGAGSEFEVRLPLTVKRPPDAEEKASAQDTNLRIVIVEDNADSRELLESLLKMDGYQVSAAPDGVLGYEAIERERPDVALVDLGLPGINGYDVARKVRRELADRPIRLVALTGYGRSEDRAAAVAAGFDEHLVKPVDPEDLANVLRRMP